MSAQKAKTSLLAKIGKQAASAHEKHKGDETTYGIINLPVGITGGIAQLKTATWDEYKPGTKNAGKPYVMLRGIAIAPETFGGLTIKGQGVMQMLPLCDQPDRKDKNGNPRTFDDNYAVLLNELRKFGIDTSSTTVNDLEEILKNLEAERPHFMFSTRGWTPPKSAQNPNPSEMCIVQYDGAVAHNGEAVDPAAETQDDSGSTAAEPLAQGEVADMQPVFDETAGDNLVALLEMANTADVEGEEPTEEVAKARIRLAELAEAAGHDEGTISNCADWDAVVDLINNPAGAEEPAAEPEPTPSPAPAAKPAPKPAPAAKPAQPAPKPVAAKPTPAKAAPKAAPKPTTPPAEPEWKPVVDGTSVYGYRIRGKDGKPQVDPKTKAPRKQIEVEVIAVDERTKTCTLKNIADERVKYEKIPWADLESPEA